MLAKIDWTKAPCEPIADLEYSGFPNWVALAAEPNRERKAADWLKDHLNIHVYWPFYTVQKHLPFRRRYVVYKPVLPGILLAPSDLMEIENRDAILDWAHLRRVKLARFITKAEVDIIRDIEALLNVPQSEKTFDYKIKDRVRFLDDTKAAFLGKERSSPLRRETESLLS
jgi:hypothetical protein